MSIYTRINGTEEPQLRVHVLIAAAGEYSRGNVTAQQVFTALALSPAEQTELTALYTRVTGGQLSQAQVDDALVLLEQGKYTIAKTKTVLGVA